MGIQTFTYTTKGNYEDAPCETFVLDDLDFLSPDIDTDEKKMKALQRVIGIARETETIFPCILVITEKSSFIVNFVPIRCTSNWYNRGFIRFMIKANKDGYIRECIENNDTIDIRRFADIIVDIRDENTIHVYDPYEIIPKKFSDYHTNIFDLISYCENFKDKEYIESVHHSLLVDFIKKYRLYEDYDFEAEMRN